MRNEKSKKTNIQALYNLHKIAIIISQMLVLLPILELIQNIIMTRRRG